MKSLLHNGFKRTIAVSLCIFYFLTQVAFAHGKDSLPPSVAHVIAAVPQKNAYVRKTTLGKTWPNDVIVLVQDVHHNVEAQKNISAILQSLISHRLATLIGVEGAFGPFRFDSLRSGSPQLKRNTLAKEYLAGSRINAPIFVGLTSEVQPPMIVGMDSPLSYNANIKAYLNSRAVHTQTQQKIKCISLKLSELGNRTLSRTQRQWLQNQAAYARGQLSLNNYLRLLIRDETSANTAIHAMLRAEFLERTIDFDRVKEEQRQVLETLMHCLGSEELKQLNDEVRGYQSGTIGFATFYRQLEMHCASHNIDLTTTPAFKRYFQYVLLADQIDIESVMNDIDNRERATTNVLALSAAERQIMNLHAHMLLVEKLTNFSLTPREWNNYQNNKYKLPLHYLGFGTALASYERFYELADQRSLSMVNKLMRHAEPGPRVMFAGGFHTDQIARELDRRGFSYIVVAPKLTRVDLANANSYLSVFEREKMPLLKLVNHAKLFILPASEGSPLSALPAHQNGLPLDAPLIAELALAQQTSDEIHRALKKHPEPNTAPLTHPKGTIFTQIRQDIYVLAGAFAGGVIVMAPLIGGVIGTALTHVGSSPANYLKLKRAAFEQQELQYSFYGSLAGLAVLMGIVGARYIYERKNPESKKILPKTLFWGLILNGQLYHAWITPLEYSDSYEKWITLGIGVSLGVVLRVAHFLIEKLKPGPSTPATLEQISFEQRKPFSTAIVLLVLLDFGTKSFLPSWGFDAGQGITLGRFAIDMLLGAGIIALSFRYKMSLAFVFLASNLFSHGYELYYLRAASNIFPLMGDAFNIVDLLIPAGWALLTYDLIYVLIAHKKYPSLTLTQFQKYLMWKPPLPWKLLAARSLIIAGLASLLPMAVQHRSAATDPRDHIIVSSKILASIKKEDSWSVLLHLKEAGNVRGNHNDSIEKCWAYFRKKWAPNNSFNPQLAMMDLGPRKNEPENKKFLRDDHIVATSTLDPDLLPKDLREPIQLIVQQLRRERLTELDQSSKKLRVELSVLLQAPDTLDISQAEKLLIQAGNIFYNPVLSNNGKVYSTSEMAELATMLLEHRQRLPLALTRTPRSAVGAIARSHELENQLRGAKTLEEWVEKIREDLKRRELSSFLGLLDVISGSSKPPVPMPQNKTPVVKMTTYAFPRDENKTPAAMTPAVKPAEQRMRLSGA